MGADVVKAVGISALALSLLDPAGHVIVEIRRPRSMPDSRDDYAVAQRRKCYVSTMSSSLKIRF